MRRRLSAVALVVLARFVCVAGDWAQLQNGPERHGYTEEDLTPPFRPAWKVDFQPERVYPSNQPIVYRGKIYIGTESGNLYAFDARTDKKLWGFRAGGPILHSAGAEVDTVFFASMDGSVYAISAEDGKLLWKYDSRLDTGFSTAVALGDGMVFALNRGGFAFALSQESGKLLWRTEVGVPLLLSPAYSPAKDGRSGRLVFGGMDIRVYCLDGRTGRILWKSERLYGQCFKDYWPVIYRGRVIVRSMIAYPKPAISVRTRWYRPLGFPLNWSDPNPVRAWYKDEKLWEQVVEHANWLRAYSDEIAEGKIPDLLVEAQRRLVDYYRKHSWGKDMFVLDLETGKERQVVPHWCAQTMNGPTSPPCVDRDGLLVVPMMFINSRWGRLDIEKNLVVDILYDGYTTDGRKITELKKPGYVAAAGGGNTDENIIATSAGYLIFSFHTQESNANYTGVWDMRTRRWMQIRGMGWGELSNNTQGGGASPPLVANGLLYHICFHSLRAWKPAGNPGGQR